MAEREIGMEVVWSRLARDTFVEVLQFIEELFNRKVAQRAADSIIEYVNLLGAFPRIGYVDDLLSTEETEVRLMNCRKSAIYYTIEDQTVIIVAIFDTRRNPAVIKEIIHSFLEENDNGNLEP